MKRAYDQEILNQPVHDPDELEHSLTQVTDVNRWLGGDRALRTSLAPLLVCPDPVRLLDVGAGNGGGRAGARTLGCGAGAPVARDCPRSARADGGVGRAPDADECATDCGRAG